MATNIFEQASRLNLMFHVPSAGNICIADLYKISEETYDRLYSSLKNKMGDTSENTLSTMATV